MEKFIAGAAMGSYIVSSGNSSYKDLFKISARLQNRRIFMIYLPRVFQNIFRFLPPGQRLLSTAVLESAFGFKYYSAEKVRQHLAWKPQVDLEGALKNIF